MRWLWRLLGTAAAVALATWLIPGIVLVRTDPGHALGTLLLVALLLGLANAFVKPIMTFLTGCLVLLTFGLFLWVINAVLLVGVSWLCWWLGIGWRVTSWPAAFWGALIISVASWLLGLNREESEA
jgi:putative membrane protein